MGCLYFALEIWNAKSVTITGLYLCNLDILTTHKALFIQRIQRIMTCQITSADLAESMTFWNLLSNSLNRSDDAFLSALTSNPDDLSQLFSSAYKIVIYGGKRRFY